MSAFVGSQAPAARRRAAGTKHYLFIITGGSKDANSGTIKILKFLAHCKPWLAKMRVSLEVKKVAAKDLQHPRLRAAFRSKNIGSFPALKTSNRVVEGVTSIADFYIRVVQDYRKFLEKQGYVEPDVDVALKRKDEPNLSNSTAEDLYRNYYGDEMTFSAAEHDQGDDTMGDNESMMGRYHDMIKRRAEMSKNRKKPAFVDAAGLDRPAAGSGSDNVEEDELIDQLVNTVVGPVSAETLRKAHSDEGGEDAREELMLRAFWENQSESRTDD